MVKHGTSHGFSVLICTILAAFMIEIFKPIIPKIWDNVDRVSTLLIKQLQIPVAVEYLSVTITASVLAILWGIFFKIRYTTKNYE